jgi:uncharacterized protein (DUF1800 family)
MTQDTATTKDPAATKDPAPTQSPQSPTVGRRALLVGAATVATVAATAAGTTLTAAAAGPPTTGAAYLNADRFWHLARRATSGPTAWTAFAIRRQGIAGWLDHQLAPATVADTAFDAAATRFGNQAQPIGQVHAAIDAGTINGWERKFSVQCEHVARMAWSNRQLQALLTDVWANHLNVATLSDGVDDSRAHYQYVLRSNALGTFTDLLTAASTHPAMLTFLDNRSSEAAHPNENQGRELLELHSLGVGSYTETDVLNSTRVLTGLSVSWQTGEFEYRPDFHYVGPVAVKGWSHPNSDPNGGLAVARSLLAYLAHHPATATRVSTKLAQYFVADPPPASLVSRMASTYLAHGTAIAPVLRMMFTSPEFAAARGAVTRRPLESVLATVRILGLGIDPSGYEGVKALVWSIGDAGQSPIDWPTPDGYPMAASAWANSTATLERWNFTRSLVSGWWPTTFTRPRLLARVCPGGIPGTHGALVDRVAGTLFGRRLAAPHRAAVLAFLGVADSTPLRADSAAVTWRLGELVTLLLDSPYHSYR